MTKEELEKEAVEKYGEVDREFIDCQDEGEVFNIGYVLGAEPRDKRIAELEAQVNRHIKSVLRLAAQIEKMKCCGNCIHCKYDENEESYEFCEKHQQVGNIAIVPCSEWKGR